MGVIGEWGRRVWFLLNRARREEELRQEMAAHRAIMADPRRFGNTRRLREEASEAWGWQWLDNLVRDSRYAVRTLARAPGFAAIAILSLALATGATTAIFSVVNGVILRPLPFGSPDRLVQVYGRDWREERGPVADTISGPVGPEELEAYGQRSTLFASLAGYFLTTAHLDGQRGHRAAVGGPGGPVVLRGAGRASADRPGLPAPMTQPMWRSSAPRSGSAASAATRRCPGGPSASTAGRSRSSASCRRRSNFLTRPDR